jgi:hypothetical protein
MGDFLRNQRFSHPSSCAVVHFWRQLERVWNEPRPNRYLLPIQDSFLTPCCKKYVAAYRMLIPPKGLSDWCPKSVNQFVSKPDRAHSLVSR